MEEKIKRLKEVEEKIEDSLFIKKGIYNRAEVEAIEITNEITKLELEKTKLKKEIDKEVLLKFEETKEKKYFGGIGVKEYSTLEYDKNKALSWAKEKDMFLILDTKEFEKVAENLNLDFVKTEKKPKVTYPKVIKFEE